MVRVALRIAGGLLGLGAALIALFLPIAAYVNVAVESEWRKQHPPNHWGGVGYVIVTLSISLAATFAEDANFIQIFGGQLDGRAAIEAAHRHIFETIYRGSHASFVLRNIRFLRPDVAVVFARAHVKFKEGDEAPERRDP